MTTVHVPLFPVLPSLNARVHVHRLLDELRTTPTPAHWEPAAEVREDATGYTLTLELPGVPPEGVELLADGGTLLVRGERGARPLASGERAVLQERQGGPFARRFRLPKQADLQDVTATAAHGVLTVRVAKVLEAAPRRIVVHGGAPVKAQPGAQPGAQAGAQAGTQGAAVRETPAP
jgi:HSP20 family protein